MRSFIMDAEASYEGKPPLEDIILHSLAAMISAVRPLCHEMRDREKCYKTKKWQSQLRNERYSTRCVLHQAFTFSLHVYWDTWLTVSAAFRSAPAWRRTLSISTCTFSAATISAVSPPWSEQQIFQKSDLHSNLMASYVLTTVTSLTKSLASTKAPFARQSCTVFKSPSLTALINFKFAFICFHDVSQGWIRRH